MKISLVGLYSLGLACTTTAVSAQITPDGSVPTEIQQQGNITKITGGSQTGGNLFHSFQDFSVSRGNTAFFNNGADIDNILSRVTGGNISNIDGAIRANGSANLFLINPAGIVFGENARLDIGGSFLGSTGKLLFDDGTEFSGLDANAPVLTINAPIGLNLRDATGDIANQGKLESKASLTLSAKNLDLQGQLIARENITLEAVDTLKIRDSINHPSIAFGGNQLFLQGNNIDIFALNNSESGLFAGGNLTLRSNNPINGDAHYYSGGDFSIERLDGNLGNLISLDDPIVRSQGNVSFADYTGASLHILAGGNVTVAGDINITGVDTTANSLQETITLSDRSQVNINGNAEPTLDIRAGTNNIGTPGIIGEGITTDTNNIATGSNIEIDGTVNNPGGKVFLSNQYQSNNQLPGGNITVRAIDTSNSLGNGGDVTIDARNDINIANGINTSSSLDSQLVTVANVEPLPEIDLATGNGGAIALLALGDITTGNFNTSAIANLNLITEVDTIDEANSTISFPNGNVRVGAGGNIKLQAGNNIKVENLNSSSAIAINSDSVALDNFSIIDAKLNLNVANGGNVNLKAENNLTTANINSNVAISDRIVSNVETTPNITLAVSELTLNIPQANLGSGGEIFLAADRIDTGSLNSSVRVTSNVNNTAAVTANDREVANLESRSKAFSAVDVFYDDINIARGGEIIIESDLANLGDLNTSIGITSNSMAFAQTNVTNSAAAESFANNQLNFRGIGDRPGEVTLDVEDLNVDKINVSSSLNAISDLDSQATSDGDASLAKADNLDFNDNDSFNQLFFDSQINFALIQLNLDAPDVDLAISQSLALSNNSIQFTQLNTCSIDAEQVSLQPRAINTAIGKIIPATGVTVENGQIILTSQPRQNKVYPRSKNSIRCK